MYSFDHINELYLGEMVSEYSPHTCTDWNVSCNNIELSKGGVHAHTHTHTHIHTKYTSSNKTCIQTNMCKTSCYNIHDICIII